ncbi:hypothetical protein PACTADRAFT_42217 [Pachysolen tannophilus NRRL Y-2460]|uniref:Fe2OG dioxygenase domain-containing protein n=1 Tax=Pachysolen tannophilus NRRL Y-2460 TaxID=669874 RepID=A0A1E4TUX4_PACTA|nr:hypothetical protein PACTADRAFT_42217 [Pachysolen tannophilus NRRL Y-2460]
MTVADVVVGPKKWVSPKETTEKLDWADLTVIDLNEFDTPEGKQKLANELKVAGSTEGFWAVVNSGFSEEDIFEIFSYGRSFFEDYSDEEKSAVEVDFTTGNYFGFKKRGNKTMFDTKIPDNSEIVNIAKFTKDNRFAEYHKFKFVAENQAKLEEISRKSFEVIRKLLILLAIGLELDENYFVDRHLYEDASDDALRFMRYHPRAASEDARIENTWARAHTDFGTLTLLFNQVVAGLQIKTPDGSWKYVKPISGGGIICNVGDTLNFWSGGFFKSTIHRVVRPPDDQVGAPRIGAFYFLRPGDKANVEIAPSPLLKELGLYKKVSPVIGTDYVRKRVTDYHNRKTYAKQSNVKFKVGEFEIVDGFD